MDPVTIDPCRTPRTSPPARAPSSSASPRRPTSTTCAVSPRSTARRALLGTLLVAESDGEIRAAYSVDEGRAIADPFVPTAGLVDLLKARSARLRGERPARADGRRRLRLVPARP